MPTAYCPREMEKYKFDLEFSDSASKPAAPRVKRSYKPEEVEALRAQARAEGERSAVALAEEAAARALNQLAHGLHEVLTMARFALDQINDDATRLAARIGRSVATHVFETAPEEYFERAIGECLDLVRREPEIRISVPASAPPSLIAGLEAMAAKHGLSGHLRIEASADLRGAECRLDWKAGGADISLEEALTRIDQIVEQHIAALQAARPSDQARAV